MILHQLKRQVLQNGAMLKRLLGQREQVVEQENNLPELPLPINTQEEFKEWERQLGVKKTKMALVSMLTIPMLSIA